MVVSDGRGGVDVAYTEVFVNPPPATINLDVTPDDASWEVYNYYYYDDYYGYFDSGTGDATLEVPSYFDYDIYVYADGYESGYDYTYLEPGDTANISITLEPSGDGGDDGGDDGDDGGGSTTAPTITSFTADPTSITSGQSSTLSWEIDGEATEVTISPGVGDVTADDDGQVTVTPTETTTYTISAANGTESAEEKTVEVTVTGGGGGGSGGEGGIGAGY